MTISASVFFLRFCAALAKHLKFLVLPTTLYVHRPWQSVLVDTTFTFLFSYHLHNGSRKMKIFQWLQRLVVAIIFARILFGMLVLFWFSCSNVAQHSWFTSKSVIVFNFLIPKLLSCGKFTLMLQKPHQVWIITNHIISWGVVFVLTNEFVTNVFFLLLSCRKLSLQVCVV